MNFRDKKEPVIELIFSLSIEFSQEDKKQITKLTTAYFRKRSVANSKMENIAGGLLWVYSRINFLFQYDEGWSQKNIAKLLNLKPKAISRKASSIMDSMNIDYFDSRFARKEVAESDPRNNFFMTKEGFIVTKDDIEKTIFQRMSDKFGENIPPIFSEENRNSETYKKRIKEIMRDKDQSYKNKSLKEFFK